MNKSFIIGFFAGFYVVLASIGLRKIISGKIISGMNRAQQSRVPAKDEHNMRKDRYVVGYGGAGNVIYGKYHLEVNGDKLKKPCNEDYAQPMTEYQAKRALKKMPSKGAKVFKLVEVNL